jgi:hypothetical protein
MSLRAFNGSIANPAQSDVNFGGNNITNATNIGATGTVTGGTLNLTNTAFAQTINFSSTNPSAPATGSISFSGFQDKLTFNANLNEFDGQVRVSDNNVAALALFGVGGVGAVIHGTSGGAEPSLQFHNFGSTGAQGVFTYETAANLFTLGDSLRIGNLNSGASCQLTFQTSNIAAPLEMTYSSNAGYRSASFGNSTYIFGPTGATAGDTGATPFLKVDGASGEGRVYDTVYNKAPTQSYASFSSSADQAIGATDASQTVTYNTTDVASADISRGGTGEEGRIAVTTAGVYKVLTSVQFAKTSASSADAYIWFAVNGNNVSNTNSTVTLAGSSAAVLATVEVLLTLAANDYVELKMAGTSTDISAEHLEAQTTPYTRPANPSVITTIVRLSP